MKLPIMFFLFLLHFDQQQKKITFKKNKIFPQNENAFIDYDNINSTLDYIREVFVSHLVTFFFIIYFNTCVVSKREVF